MRKFLLAALVVVASAGAASAATWEATISKVDADHGVITLDDGTELTVEGKLAPGDFLPGDKLEISTDEDTGEVTDIVIGA